MRSEFLTAEEAAAALGISKATLYSYVSRGLLRSEPGTDAGRARRYYVADVAALHERKAQRRNPARSAAQALDFGAPVLESAVTLIEDGRLYYRGRDACLLARSSGHAELAARAERAISHGRTLTAVLGDKAKILPGLAELRVLTAETMAASSEAVAASPSLSASWEKDARLFEMFAISRETGA